MGPETTRWAGRRQEVDGLLPVGRRAARSGHAPAPLGAADGSATWSMDQLKVREREVFHSSIAHVPLQGPSTAI